jgi:hypothetical protein
MHQMTPKQELTTDQKTGFIRTFDPDVPVTCFG